MSVNKCIQLYNHHHNHKIDTFHPSKKFPEAPLHSVLSPDFQSLQSLICFLSVYFAISRISSNWNHEFRNLLYLASFT